MKLQRLQDGEKSRPYDEIQKIARIKILRLKQKIIHH